MNAAFIPVRGGSKSIPLKNIRLICGKPLVYWTVKAACACKYIDKVYIATDSEKIKETVVGFTQGAERTLFSKAEVIGRSEESAADTASTESAMLEFADKYYFDNIVLIQATSPLLDSSDLNRGFEVFGQEGTDSVLSVVRQKRFLWGNTADRYAHSLNYDIFQRPRRQDFEGYLVENGAFYITSRESLLQSQNRISGNIKTIEMCEDTFFEIDEPSDWNIVEELMKKRMYRILDGKPEIKMFLTDCDGCLTDGGMYYSEKGDELKKFNARDGMAFSLLKEKGIIVGIITGENVQLNQRRADKLKLDIYEAGCKDKGSIIRKLSSQYGIALENIAYVGDDVNDLEAVKMVGFGCCPADAAACIQDAADYTAEAYGGKGVIREIADKILNVQG